LSCSCVAFVKHFKRKSLKYFSGFFTFTLLLACASAEVKQSPSSTGAIAPDFTLPDQDGKIWTLGEVLKN